MAYVGITHDGKNYWGAGMDEDIIKASIHALVVAVNKLPEMTKDDNHQDDRPFPLASTIVFFSPY